MQNNVKITTDSASDLNELFKTRDIGEFPLYVMLGDDQIGRASCRERV